MPVALMVDGPSLGGFVCPATITTTELWKMGQVRPGDAVRFKKLTVAQVGEGRGLAGEAWRESWPSHSCLRLYGLAQLPAAGAPHAQDGQHPVPDALYACCIPAPCLQAYTQRLTVDHKVVLMRQVACGALAAAAAEADLSDFKVCLQAQCIQPLFLLAGCLIAHSLPAPEHLAQPCSHVPPPRATAPSALLAAQVEVPETPPTEAVLRLIPATPGGHPGAKVRMAGDRYIFLEYGPMELDINLRVRCASRCACCAGRSGVGSW